MTRTQEIRDRLEAATNYRPTPWRRTTNTAGDHPGVTDSTGCIVATDAISTANLIAHAPADIQWLLDQLGDTK